MSDFRSPARRFVLVPLRARQRPIARRTAASKVAAHGAESFAFLPFAACVARAPACLRRCCALRRSLRAFLAERVAAWSMSVSALPSFLVTLFGIGWPAHAGLVSAASNAQCAVVQGSVVVVGGGGASVVVEVVLLVVVLATVVVEVVLLVVVLATVASRRTSPPPSAT